MPEKSDSSDPILIKKYGNRRLYDTSRSRYITLEDLAGMVRAGTTVKVVEASTDRDLTRAVLLQVLLEQQDALNLIPVELLHALLRVQGTLDQAPFAAYLSATTSQFLNQGNQVAQQLMTLMTGFAPTAQSPQANAATPPPAEEPAPPEEPDPNPPSPPTSELTDVRARMSKLINKLEKT